MNSTFELNRFGKLIKTDFLINKSTVVKLLLGLLLGMSIVYFFNAYFFSPKTTSTIIINDEVISGDAEVAYNLYLPLLEICIFLIPILIFYNLYHKVKDVQNAMLPASQLEKMLSAIIQVSIITPALLMILFGLLLLLFYLLNSQSIDLNAQNLQAFFKNYFTMIQIQSFVFLGVFWFRDNKILKMILTVIAVTVAFTAIVALLVEHHQFWNWLAGIEVNQGLVKFLNDCRLFLEEYGNIILAILFPLLPWTVAFWKFKRTQI